MPRPIGKLHRVDAGGVRVFGIGAVVNAQLKRNGAKARLPQIALDKAQQPYQIAPDPADQVVHPHRHAGQVFGHIFVHQRIDKGLHLLRRQRLERLAAAAQGVFQHQWVSVPLILGGKLGLFAGRRLDDVLQKIAKGAALVFFKPGGAYAQPPPK